jgi:hypothetical protein
MRRRCAANPNAAPSARHVLDDDGLTKRCTHALGHDTSNNICGPASSKRHDHCDRPRRIGLCQSEAGRDRERGSARGQLQKFPAGKFQFVPFSEMVAMWRLIRP